MKFLETYQRLVFEEFETMEKFLLNPNYSDKFRSELVDKFLAAGGSILGAGRFGQVFSFPTWKYVLKTFKDDHCYVKFVRLVLKNQNNPAFPKFYDKPRQIVPFFKRFKSEPFLYVVRTERLFPLDMDEQEFYKLDGMMNASRIHHLVSHHKDKLEWWEDTSPTSQKQYELAAEIFYKENPKYINLFDAYNKVWDLSENDDQGGCGLDIHKNNFMQRENGDIVVIDPLWFDEMGGVLGAADRAAKMEYDYYGMHDDMEREEDPEPYLQGGKLPVKKRKKPVKPVPQIQTKEDDYEYPF